MKWIILAPFISSERNLWLGQFVPGPHTFRTVPSDDVRKYDKATGARGWLGHFRHAWKGLRVARQEMPAGIITAFPQLPVTVGLLSTLFVPRVPIVAWTFNLGSLPRGLKRWISVRALRRVDALVVHSRAEIIQYSECFDVPRGKIVFVPLQRVIPEKVVEEDTINPYAIAVGTANRDYRSLFEALRRHPVRTLVIAGPHAIAGLDIPPCVEVMSGLSLDECHRWVQGARVSIVPVANPTTASGQVTLLNSMGMGRATIVTRCPGSVDYVRDGETALLVSPGNPDELSAALQRLWHDDDYRHRLGQQASEEVASRYSDESIGKVMGAICEAVEQGRQPASVVL
jgi:glycosyltransferase involved in cell wall biosynthesis